MGSKVSKKEVPEVVSQIDEVFSEVSLLANQSDIGSDFSHFISHSKGVYWICLIRKKTRSNLARRFMTWFDPESPEILGIRYFVSGELSETNLDLGLSNWKTLLMTECLTWASKLSFEQLDQESND